MPRPSKKVLDNVVAAKLCKQLIDAYGREKAVEDLAHRAGYWMVPPTIEECLDGSDFLGSLGVGQDLYPYWRKVLKEVYPNQFGSPFQELIVSGSIGFGKSWFSRICVFYDLVKVLCLEDPHTQFGIGRHTPIVFAFINTTLKQSDSVLFAEFKEWVEYSPFCQAMRLRARNPKKELLPYKISLKCGSRGSHFLGDAVVTAWLSELNFAGEHQKLQAFKQYSTVRTRRKTRFMQGVHAQMPGHLILDSSRSDSAAFLENHIKAVRGQDDTLVIENAIWEVLGDVPGKDIYSGKTFKVFIGDEGRDPKILEGPKATLGIPGHLIIDAPIEYYSDFSD